MHRHPFTVRLLGEHWCSVHCRQREGETLEATLWRALSELRKREIDGMPKPSPKAKEQRRLRALLHSADASRPAS